MAHSQGLGGGGLSELVNRQKVSGFEADKKAKRWAWYSPSHPDLLPFHSAEGGSGCTADTAFQTFLTFLNHCLPQLPSSGAEFHPENWYQATLADELEGYPGNHCTT